MEKDVIIVRELYLNHMEIVLTATARPLNRNGN